MRKAESKQRPKSMVIPSAHTLVAYRETEKRRDAVLDELSSAKGSQRVSIEASSDQSSIETRKSEIESSKPGLFMAKRGSRVMAAVAAWNGKDKEVAIEAKNIKLDPQAIESAFESVLVSPDCRVCGLLSYNDRIRGMCLRI